MEYFNILIVFTTIIPILAYLLYIYIRDEYKKEPIPMLLLAVFAGIVAATANIMADYPELETFKRPIFFNWWECFYAAFRLYAIPSEVVKYVILATFLFLNRYYDEYVDAIVYSVCIALAFIGLKNGWFLYFNSDGQIYRGILTAIVLIPAHFTIGVVMGYYFGLARLCKKKMYYVAALIVPILIDGLFCSLFLWIDDQMPYYFIAIVILLVLGFFMHFITHHVNIDHLISEDIDRNNINECE